LAGRDVPFAQAKAKNLGAAIPFTPVKLTRQPAG